MRCEWCEAGKDGDVAQGEIYEVGGDLAAYCVNCLEERVPEGDRNPIVIASDEMQAESAAFKKVQVVMHDYARKKNHIMGNQNDLHRLFERIVNFLTNEIESEVRFRENIGIQDTEPAPQLSGAYCPMCRSPLLQSTMIDEGQCLLASSYFEHTDLKKRQAYVCLGCNTVYTLGVDHDE